MSFVRVLLLMAGLGLLAACDTNDLKDPPVPLGDFVLGLNIAVGEGAQAPGISRQATPEQWKAAIEKAMTDRFGRYEGSRIYNFSIRVDAYILAPPGIPLVASPRSALVFTVFVFDDATRTLLNPEGKQITMLEGVSPQSFIGSGITQNKEKQIARMSYRAALAVQKYLLENPDWFNLPPVPVAEGAGDAATAPETPASPGSVAPQGRPASDITVTPIAPPPNTPVPAN